MRKAAANWITSTTIHEKHLIVNNLGPDHIFNYIIV